MYKKKLESVNGFNPLDRVKFVQIRQVTSNYNESSYLIDLFWAAPLTMDGRRYVAESINSIAYFYNHNGIIEMGLDYSEIAGNKRFVEEI